MIVKGESSHKVQAYKCCVIVICVSWTIPVRGKNLTSHQGLKEVLCPLAHKYIYPGSFQPKVTPNLESWLKEILYTLVFSLIVAEKNFLKRQTLTPTQKYFLPQVGKVPGSQSRVLHRANIQGLPLYHH